MPEPSHPRPPHLPTAASPAAISAASRALSGAATIARARAGRRPGPDLGAVRLSPWPSLGGAAAAPERGRAVERGRITGRGGADPPPAALPRACSRGGQGPGPRRAGGPGRSRAGLPRSRPCSHGDAAPGKAVPPVFHHPAHSRVSRGLCRPRHTLSPAAALPCVCITGKLHWHRKLSRLCLAGPSLNKLSPSC